ncbi:MAG TPA: hypothetical protein VFM23_01785 [Gemmatimonadales bacterium]|nr:hypothetical protein [Gemmatimonadales bacterium]
MANKVAPPRWVGVVVSAWTFLVLGADLKTAIHPNIHWLVTAVAVTCALPYLLRLRLPLRLVLPGLIPSCLLALAVLLAGIRSDTPLYAIAEAAKLAIILIVARGLFTSEPALAHHAVRGFVWAIGVNLALLLFGLLGAGTAAELGPSRWGTLLNYPGSLARLGFLGLCYAGYMVLVWKQPLRHLALLAACGMLIYFDGSRTALLVIAVLVPYLLVIRLTEGGPRRFARLSRFATIGVACAAALLGFAGWRWLQAQTSVPEGTGAVARIAQFAVSVKLNGAAGLALADPVRVRMIETGMDALRNASLIGHGVGTTQADTDFGLMVVHMTYLQIIGDLGVLGLMAYLWLVLGWVAWLPRAWRNIRRIESPSSRALYFNAIFLLAAFALSGLFHPLSTEWSEWIMFIVPSALFWEIV